MNQKVYEELFNAKSTVIAYGANPSFDSDPSKIEKWGLEKEGYYLIVGRMIPDNNADLILEGFIQSDSTKKLVIVGDVPFQDEYAIRLKIMKDERLLFTGYVTDPEELKSLYHNCFAYFHGHEYGGTNPTLIKAMAYGCAILALDTRFSRETLQNGKHGWFFGKNPTDLKNIISKAKSEHEKIQELRDTARDGLTDKYNWDRVTGRYLEVFEGLRNP
ncbi:glycosyltransferase [Aquiflexum sp.]|uniref:glycosyltransferase n=1 Tax=Aquiflexum sp. TaxID=1872584 RepID=UPI0035946BD9